jgi:RNA polymerase sigma-70 factor (ECF subfamily)
VAQEVFARLFMHRDSFRQGSKFSTYLWRIALNQSYNELRRPRRRHETAFEPPGETDAAPFEPVSDSPSPDAAITATETAALVREAMRSLPEEYRTVLVLRHYEDLKYREIADVLGIPEGTVKTRMTEALSEMARRLRRPLDLKLAPPPDRRARVREMLVL